MACAGRAPQMSHVAQIALSSQLSLDCGTDVGFAAAEDNDNESQYKDNVKRQYKIEAAAGLTCGVVDGFTCAS